MSHAMHGTRTTSSSSFSSIPSLRRLITSGNPCADPRELHEVDGYTEPQPRTGYEPNRIVDYQIINGRKGVACIQDNLVAVVGGRVGPCVLGPVIFVLNSRLN